MMNFFLEIRARELLISAAFTVKFCSSSHEIDNNWQLFTAFSDKKRNFPSLDSINRNKFLSLGLS